MSTPQELLLEKARQVLADGALGPSSPVPSPCVSICLLDDANQGCTGCFRTLPEIGDWSVLTSDEKRAVWARIQKRIQVSINSPDQPQAQG